MKKFVPIKKFKLENWCQKFVQKAGVTEKILMSKN